jgi:hypothetical protein
MILLLLHVNIVPVAKIRPTEDHHTPVWWNIAEEENVSTLSRINMLGLLSAAISIGSIQSKQLEKRHT